MRENRQHKIFKPRREFKSWLIIIAAAVLVHLAFIIFFKTDYLKVFERKDIGKTDMGGEEGETLSDRKRFSLVDIQDRILKDKSTKPVIEIESDALEQDYDFSYDIPPIELPEIGELKAAGEGDDRPAIGSRGGIVKPRPLFIPWPKYPKGVGKQFEGQVKLKLYVNTNGEVEEIEIVKGLPSEALNRRALEAASKIRFTPGEKDGEPAAMWIQISIGFQSR